MSASNELNLVCCFSNIFLAPSHLIRDCLGLWFRICSGPMVGTGPFLLPALLKLHRQHLQGSPCSWPETLDHWSGTKSWVCPARRFSMTHWNVNIQCFALTEGDVSYIKTEQIKIRATVLITAVKIANDLKLLLEPIFCLFAISHLQKNHQVYHRTIQCYCRPSLLVHGTVDTGNKSGFKKTKK